MSRQVSSIRVRAAVPAFLAVACLLSIPGTATGTEYYVKTTANGGNNAASGLSWAEAKATISAAMSLVDGNDKIHAAAGTYNEKVTFASSSGNQLLGGYPAGGEGTRAPRTNPTILDGTGAGTTKPMIEVPYAPNNAGYTGIVIDGLTIRNGTNTSQYGTGGIESYALGLTIRDCLVENNTATNNSWAGGIHIGCGHLDNGAPLLEGCIIRNNTGSGLGGLNIEGAGAKSWNYTATMRNCLVSGNKSTTSSTWGVGAMDVFYPAGVAMINCTIADNLVQGSPTTRVAGIRVAGYDEYQQGQVTIKNSIIWHPTGDDIYIARESYADTGTVTMTYSDVQDAGDATGTGMISATPLFVTPGTDYRLTACSPCMDHGTSAGAALTDLDGNGRPQHGAYDMGAYEYTGDFSDSDADGVLNACDSCPETPACANPVNSSGCPVDTDADGVVDGCDTCPGTPACARPVDAQGCAADGDNDGVRAGCDACPDTAGGDPVDAEGCSTADADGDGVLNDQDTCPDTQACARPVDAQGCPADTDNDGVKDGCDTCPGTRAGEPVDGQGCSIEDADGDGIANDQDMCPDTPACAGSVDPQGCPADGDNDGIEDGCDACPATPAGEPVDAQGCSTADTDEDGVLNDLDTCPNTLACARPVNAQGCPADGDNDGVKDGCDACPATAAGDAVDGQGCSTADTDGDGTANDRDTCPGTAACARPVNAQGCPADGDNDGVEDGCDACPATAAGDAVDGQGCSTADTDGDGTANDRDTCPGTAACARPVDTQGCPADGDNDGVKTGCDACPATAAGEAVDAEGCSTADSDADGVRNDRDACPNTPAGRGVDSAGCPTPEEPSGRPLEGAGVADVDGRFGGTAVDEDGKALAEVVVTGAEPGTGFSYTLIESEAGVIGAPGPGAGTFAGFARGLGLGRTLTVETAAPPGTYLVVISISFSAAELALAGVEPSEVTIHVFNEASGAWGPVGTSIGRSAPTNVVGQSGYLLTADGGATFWAVRNELSQFAVGAITTALPDSGQQAPTASEEQEPPSVCAWFDGLICGTGMLQAVAGTLMGLMLLPVHRRP